MGVANRVSAVGAAPAMLVRPAVSWFYEECECRTYGAHSHSPSHPGLPLNFLYAAPSSAAYAAFLKESRIGFIGPTGLRGKFRSGLGYVWRAGPSGLAAVATKTPVASRVGFR